MESWTRLLAWQWLFARVMAYSIPLTPVWCATLSVLVNGFSGARPHNATLELAFCVPIVLCLVGMLGLFGLGLAEPVCRQRIGVPLSLPPGGKVGALAASVRQRLALPPPPPAFSLDVLTILLAISAALALVIAATARSGGLLLGGAALAIVIAVPLGLRATLSRTQVLTASARNRMADCSRRAAEAARRAAEAARS